MTNRKIIVGSDCRLALEKAVAKRMPLTITTHEDYTWRVYKSNFIALEDNRLLLAPPVLDTHDGHMEPAQGQELAVAFKLGDYKNLFLTRAVAQDRYKLDDGIFMLDHYLENTSYIQTREDPDYIILDFSDAINDLKRSAGRINLDSYDTVMKNPKFEVIYSENTWVLLKRK